MTNSHKGSFYVEIADVQKDRGEILRLWQLGFPSVNRFEEKYDWFYSNNPAGKPYLYFLKSGNVNIGIEGIGPKKWLLNGESIRSGLFVDLVVDPAFRSLGPALRLIKDSTEQSICDLPILYGFPNPKSLPVYKRGGFELLGMMSRYAKPLQYTPYILQYSKLLAQLFGGIIDFAYKLTEGIINKKLHKSLSCNVDNEFDKDFDSLWSLRRQDAYCMAQRDKEFLLWRFKNNPLENYKLFTINSRAAEALLGYIVYKTNAVGNVFIIDFLASDNNVNLFWLFRLFGQKMRMAGYKSVSVEFFGEESIVKILKQCCFKCRDVQPIICALNSEKLERKSLKNWYITSADRD